MNNSGNELDTKLTMFTKVYNKQLTSDENVLTNIKCMLLKNNDEFGDFYCPCKIDKTDTNNICPCIDIKENDKCHCGLFV